jgi:predicted nuclease of predicted toxin-antitoxin system
MGGRTKKSKKPSAVSSHESPEGVFYIDRNLGKIAVPAALRAAGFSAEVHDDHLPSDAPDEVWISLCGQRNWIAITKDKNIRFRTHELSSIKVHKAKIFVLRAKNLTGQAQGDLLARHARKLLKFALTERGPFVAGIDRAGNIKKYDI